MILIFLRTSDINRAGEASRNDPDRFRGHFPLPQLRIRSFNSFVLNVFCRDWKSPAVLSNRGAEVYWQNSVSNLLDQELLAAQDLFVPATTLRALSFLLYDIIQTLAFRTQSLTAYGLDAKFRIPKHRTVLRDHGKVFLKEHRQITGQFPDLQSDISDVIQIIVFRNVFHQIHRFGQYADLMHLRLPFR